MESVLEVCAASLASVKAAAQGGAARIELCSALSEGGVTPSAGLISMARKVEGVKLHVLIRPRGGDFVYDAAETECMMADIRMAAECGADGVVIGALRCDGSVDEDVCRAMVDAAKGMSITFHRAFDLCREQAEALERVIALGCHRLLTSGGAASAFEGSQRIAELNRQAAGRIVIMPGAGVTAANAAEILRLTGCHEIHASAREKADSVMAYRHHGVAMGAAGSDEFVRLETSQRAVAEVLDSINRLP